MERTGYKPLLVTQPLQLPNLPLQHILYTSFHPVKTTSFPPDILQLWHCHKSLSACLLGLWCAIILWFPSSLTPYLLFVLHLLAIPQGPVSLWHWLFSFILRLSIAFCLSLVFHHLHCRVFLCQHPPPFLQGLGKLLFRCTRARTWISIRALKPLACHPGLLTQSKMEWNRIKKLLAKIGFFFFLKKRWLYSIVLCSVRQIFRYGGRPVIVKQSS